MNDKIFIDTNMLVYARDSGAGKKHVKALSVVTELWRTRKGRLSTQVLSEYFVTVTQKLKPGMSAENAWKDIEALSAWNPIAVDWKLQVLARAIHSRNSISWWDSLIVAAAEVSGCSTIYSEDLSHASRYGSVKIINPLL